MPGRLSTPSRGHVDFGYVVHMSNAVLLRLRGECDAELQRREPDKDAAANIRGQEWAKRAVLVAAAGGHSVLFFGPPGCGKTMLRCLSRQLGTGPTFEMTSCLCGNFGGGKHCACTPEAIRRFWTDAPDAEIYVEVPNLAAEELFAKRPGTTIKMMQDKLKGIPARGGRKLDKHADEMLRIAKAELNISPAKIACHIKIADSVARLDYSDVIKQEHLSESLIYRPPRMRG